MGAMLSLKTFLGECENHELVHSLRYLGIVARV